MASRCFGRGGRQRAAARAVTVLDASAWISYLVWEDEHHRATREWIDGIPPSVRRFVGPTLLLIEVAGAVARRSGRPEMALRLVARLASTPALLLFPLDDARRDECVRLAASLRLPAADVIYVDLARHLGVPLVTWDRQQRERAAGIVQVMTPAEALAGSS